MRRMVYLMLVLFCVFLSACTAENPTGTTAPAQDNTTMQTNNTTPARIATKELAEQIEIGMSITEVRGLLGDADADIGSGTTIEMYVLNDEGEVAIFSYEQDSEGNLQVSRISIEVLPVDSPLWNLV